MQSCVKDGVSDTDEGPRSSAPSTPAAPKNAVHGTPTLRPRQGFHIALHMPTARVPPAFDRRAPVPLSNVLYSVHSNHIPHPRPAPCRTPTVSDALHRRTIPYMLSCPPAPPRQLRPPLPLNIAWLNEAEVKH
jgi:hypothetical protein